MPRAELGRYRLCQIQRKLWSVSKISIVNSLKYISLIERRHARRELGTIDLQVGYDSTEPIDWNVVENFRHDGFNLHTANQVTLSSEAKSKRLDLRNSSCFRILDFRLHVAILRRIRRRDANSRESNGDLETRIRARAIDFRAVIATFVSIRNPQTLRQLCDLRTTRGDPVANQHDDSTHGQLDVQIVRYTAQTSYGF